MILFLTEATYRFDRLAARHGLSCTFADEHRVRYESGTVFLSVNFDNGRSYELGVEIGQKILNKTERPFSLPEVLRLRDVPEASLVDGMMASDATELASNLRLLSELTSEYADDFLSGNDFSFAQVAELREKESNAYAIQRDLRSARARAQAAWSSKNYAAVVAALEPVKPHLSPSEVKRLEYAHHKTMAA